MSSPNKDEVAPDKDLRTLSSVGEESALEEGLPPPQEKAFDNDSVAANGKSSTKDASNRLSVVSQQYDRENKGFLDDAQARMRELDVSNRGYLTNDRVYNMMKEQLEMQKQMVTQKRLIIGLLIFSVVLALANMGTAFAAATLAKDTTVDSASGAMVSTADGEVVGTMSKKKAYEAETGIDHSRILQNYGGTVGTATTEIRILKTTAETMWNTHCAPADQSSLVLVTECDNPSDANTNTNNADLSCSTKVTHEHTNRKNEPYNTYTYTYTNTAGDSITVDCSKDGVVKVQGNNYCPVSGLACCGTNRCSGTTSECCDYLCGYCKDPNVDYCPMGCSSGTTGRFL